MKTDSLPFFLRDMLVAGCLLTRLPLPKLSDAAFATGARATWAYPLAGLLVAGCAALCMLMAQEVGLPDPVVAGLVLAVMILTTGAMHEDGLSDTADGFWGGFTPERRLEIMKDSQIGTYGTLALVLVCGLRWICYSALVFAGPAVLFAVAALSRAAMPALMHSLPHARSDGLARSVGRPEMASVTVGCAIALGVAVLCLGDDAIAPVVMVTAAAMGIAGIARRKIGGQTGDVLGATQQICELTALLTLTAMLT